MVIFVGIKKYYNFAKPYDSSGNYIRFLKRKHGRKIKFI